MGGASGVGEKESFPVSGMPGGYPLVVSEINDQLVYVVRPLTPRSAQLKKRLHPSFNFTGLILTHPNPPTPFLLLWCTVDGIG
jgi:hypothetical protein